MDKDRQSQDDNSQNPSHDSQNGNNDGATNNNDKNNNLGGFSFPSNPIQRGFKPRVIRLNLATILTLVVVIIASLIILNNVLQPSLGQEVTLSEYLRNINQNNYSELSIRNDGNAVANGKYIDVVNEISDEERDEFGDEQDLNVKKEDDLEEKNLSELVSEFDTPQNFGEFVEQVRNTDFSINPDRIEEIIVLQEEIIIDWRKDDTKDWLIKDVTEEELKEQFSANNLDIDTLPVQVTFLRAAATDIDYEKLVTGTENERYTKSWIVDDSIYARVVSEKVLQNYVNYGTATRDFTQTLQDEGVDLGASNYEVSVQPIRQIDIVTILNIAFIGLLAFLGFMLLRSMNGANGGLMRFGQSKARMFFGQKMDIDFDDVAGVDEAKEQLREVVDFLKNPKKYQKLGAKIPRGALMIGQPGTGKTLLARAVAGEAGVPFFHTSGSEFEEMLVGAGASRVRDLFEKAKKAAPALIFIDEIDAVGRKRGTTIQSSSTEQTLNQILVEMDGFEQRDNVIVIAATNRPDVLDPALLRPGRFDRKVVLDTPDIEGRKKILEIHAQNKPLSKDVDLGKVAKRTVGFSGADLENMLNEAAIIVAKENRKEITAVDIEEAATKVQTGPIRRRKRSDRELRMTAYHEAAHAIVMKFTPESDPVHRITILSRGMALGYTMPLPQSDELQMTRTKMLSKIAVLLAGYTAEEKIFGDVTTGASNDIEKATNIAKSMVKKFGMSKKLGLVKYGSDEDESQIGWGSNQGGYSDATAEIIDEEVRTIVSSAQKEAERILTEHKVALDKISQALLEDEVLEAEDFEGFFSEEEKKQAEEIKSATQLAAERLKSEHDSVKSKSDGNNNTNSKSSADVKKSERNDR